MAATGISDGWVIVSIMLLIIAVIFLVAWISAASRGRAARKELGKLQEEIVGLQALTTLPPLHEIDWSQAQGSDPGTSLVFASAKELKRRRENKSAQTAESKPDSAPLVADALQQATQTQEKQGQSAHSSTQAAADSVTAQVHEAIFASVTESHLKKTAEPSQGVKLKSEDLPPIHAQRKKTTGKAQAQAQAQKPAKDGDASLSSRIPKL